MVLNERTEGDFRIYAGALEAPKGDGFIAALIVNRVCQQTNKPRETFRDDSLACGHRWVSSGEAIDYAMNKAREVLAKERLRAG